MIKDRTLLIGALFTLHVSLSFLVTIITPTFSLVEESVALLRTFFYLLESGSGLSLYNLVRSVRVIVDRFTHVPIPNALEAVSSWVHLKWVEPHIASLLSPNVV